MWAELGKRLAERWLSMLVLPGALYLAVGAAARALGHSQPFALERLTRQITAWANASVVGTVGGQVVLLTAVLAGAAAIGLVAQGLGTLTEELHLSADWHNWPAGARHLGRRITERRRKAWREAAEAWHDHREAAAARAYHTPVDPAARRHARAAMVRIAVEDPARPTWSGDRIHAVAVRLERDYHLDLVALWPHLWLILPDTVRAEITAARQALIRATNLSAWALLYLPLAGWWWPAVAITAVLAVAGRQRTRSAAGVYATLLEAAARVHARDLAEALGLNPAEALTRDSGDAITRHLTPSAPPRPAG
ncbi:hypothetical protein ACWCQ0_31490 [Streptomyces massasporeus]|uniref:hypothetical protein n=1 Tax=Streptomyces massasporeus TaxID=67324 RepID=UPI0033F68B27